MLIFSIFRYFQHKLRRIRLKNSVGYIGSNCKIGKYYCIEGKRLYIEDNVHIAPGAWIKASEKLAKGGDLELRIGSGCDIGRFVEIFAMKQIILEDHVLIAERVYISDNLHGYENPNIPILKQPVIQNGTVRIGNGTWIGAGVAILGSKIGKNCVIGSNAVVTHDIPDYCVAVGIPAKIIKRYNFDTKKWEKTNPDGSFI